MVFVFFYVQELRNAQLANVFVCGRVPWLYQYWPVGFVLFVVLYPGTPKGSTGSGSGFKGSQKTGQRLKVSSDRLEEAVNRTCDPWFTRHRFIPYTTAAYTTFIFAAAFLGCTSTGRVGLCFCGSMSRNSRRFNRQWFWF